VKYIFDIYIMMQFGSGIVCKSVGEADYVIISSHDNAALYNVPCLNWTQLVDMIPGSADHGVSSSPHQQTKPPRSKTKQQHKTSTPKSVRFDLRKL
jgi:hypothetical protein